LPIADLKKAESRATGLVCHATIHCICHHQMQPGPALKNEMMLPAVLDPWASHALYEAANLAKNAPGSKVWLYSTPAFLHNHQGQVANR
jgi:hypothetical protein